MSLNKFRAQSPDPELAKANRTGRTGDATLARLAHLNKIVDFLTLAEHADNAAAIAAGLVAGDLYHTAGAVKVVV
jgi:uncharacterized membrane-anchored protein